MHCYLLTYKYSNIIYRTMVYLSLTITDDIIHPWRTKRNQYASKLPSKRGVLSYFGHNVITTSRSLGSRGQTLHNQRAVQLPCTHCLLVLACSTTNVRLQGQRLPPPLPMNQPHTPAHVTLTSSSKCCWEGKETKKEVDTALLWLIAQRVVVISYWRLWILDP